VAARTVKLLVNASLEVDLPTLTKPEALTAPKAAKPASPAMKKPMSRDGVVDPFAR
jgi:hypothetical protein